MKQVVKLVIVIAVIIVCILVVRRTFQRHAFNAKLQDAHDVYESANTVDEFKNARSTYSDILKYASGREEKRMAEAGVASCDAWVSYMETMNKPDLEGYARTIDHMERAIELTGDPDDVWRPKLEEMRRLHRDAQGPTVEEMRARFAKGKSMPFDDAMADLEALHRWKRFWAEQGRHQEDPEREAIFKELHQFLVDNHIRRLEESVAAARRIPDDDRSLEGLSIVARPVSLVEFIRFHAPERVEEYERLFANDFRRAERALALLQAMSQ